MEDPKIAIDYLDETSFLQIYDEEDFYLTDKLLQNEVIEEQTIQHPILDKSLLKHETFIKCDLEKLDATDTIFKACDL